MKACSIEGCDRKYLASGMCSSHWQRNSRYGDPLATAASVNFESRFWSKVDKSGECWEWTASLTTTGYGQFSVGGRAGRPHGAHRVSYELTNGPIPAGLDIDHICHNTICVNPAHLRAVTHQKNMENIQGAHRDARVNYRGVSLKSNGRYQAYACSQGKTYYAGTHDSAELAAEAAANLRNELMTHNTLDRTAA